MTVSPASTTTCPLCVEDGGLVLLRHARLRIIRATSPDVADTPAFYRVVWNAHVAEWSDLAEADQALCMRAVTVVERVLRQQLQPTKINLAALGNVVPHLHWHVIARFDWDNRFPAPVWAVPVRDNDAEQLAQLNACLPVVDAALAALSLDV